MSLNKWIIRRENGFPTSTSEEDLLMRRIYRAMNGSKYSDDLNNLSEYGAVFNLEFSPNGNVLAAACERKTIRLFDTVTTKQIQFIPDAHKDNVNCIKYLNERLFASCSDDTTVALWDMRYMNTKLRSLHGHSNWVKNVEYSRKDNLLVTSGFDGSIFTWDISSHTEQGLIYQKVFHTSGLMRCVVAPDDSKLVICSTGGYLMIIHKLDLTTLHKDLCGFRPSMYRLMQMGQQYIPQAAKFDHVFSKKQKRNRVELVTDFPEGNDAEVVLALQIHPHGHAVLSRNVSYDEKTEWSCVHDINEEKVDIAENSVESSRPRKRKLASIYEDEEVNEGNRTPSDDTNYGVTRRQRSLRSRPLTPANVTTPRTNANNDSNANANTNTNINDNTNSNTNMPNANSSPNPAVTGPANNRDSHLFSPDIWAAEVTVQERTIRQNRSRNSNSITGYNYVYAINSGVLPISANLTNDSDYQQSNTSAASGTNTTNNARRRNNAEASGNRAIPQLSRLPLANDDSLSNANFATGQHPLYDRFRLGNLIIPAYWVKNHETQIFENPKKLMYYVVEPNKGKGFIKEPCFSSDGRIICSPCDNGIRLLTFTDTCSEFPRHTAITDNLKHKPLPLVVQKEIQTHQSVVLCTKFSPREPLLVSGCRNGQIVWYYPNL